MVRDASVEDRAARLELTVLEREAQIEQLQIQLAEARREVVRTLAKLPTTATRAEAASALAEAEVGVQGLRPAGAQAPPEQQQARQLLAMSSGEFNNQNYGGALYLANQAKALAAVIQARAAEEQQKEPRTGETVFAAPLRLQTTGRTNVREGPGRDFRVLFTLERGAALTGYSYAEGWVRVAAEDGRGGWVHQGLVTRRGDAPP